MSLLTIVAMALFSIGVVGSVAYGIYTDHHYALSFKYRGVKVHVREGAINKPRFKTFKRDWRVFIDREYTRVDKLAASLCDTHPIPIDTTNLLKGVEWIYVKPEAVALPDGRVGYGIPTPWAAGTGYHYAHALSDHISGVVKCVGTHALSEGTDGHEARLVLCGRAMGWPHGMKERQKLLDMRRLGVYDYTGFLGKPFTEKELESGLAE